MKIDTYISENIQLCAFLLTQAKEGIELLEVREDQFHHFSFILTNPQKCEELKRKYQNGAPAPAIDLFAKRELLLGEIKGKNSRSSKGVIDHE